MDELICTKLEEEDPSTQDYYNEYCRLYLANVVLTSQIKKLIGQKHELSQKLNRLQEEEADSSCNMERGRRHRRTANEIRRHYKCPIEECQKSYGSEGSLNQHIRIKHPPLFEKLIVHRDEENVAPRHPNRRDEQLSLLKLKHLKYSPTG